MGYNIIIVYIISENIFKFKESDFMEQIIKFMHKFLGDDSEFTDKELETYKLALTHSSNGSLVNHNQRLAFIGDSVLRLIIREHLYEQHPDWAKGQLSDKAKGTETKLGIEQDENFAPIAIELKVLEYMDIQNQTFEVDDITPNAEAFEALFGAVYLTRGLGEAKRLAKMYVLKE
ncbi:ribonuclease III domain-containing protein [Methanococcoides methylutens]|uniref:ribonuclease III domain-containing protein n=1 Tax=Methanococcoides methylutens TaxID=2226 RepID=UPI0009E02D40|nr:ribonuclease III domain-containing protein [Methanococcoides methylutens]